MMEAPKKRYELEIKVSGWSMDELSRILDRIGLELVLYKDEIEQEFQVVSGDYWYKGTYHADADQETYNERLYAYVDWIKEQRKTEDVQ